MWGYACSAMWAEWKTAVLSNHYELICLPVHSNKITLFFMEAAPVQINVLSCRLKFVVILESRIKSEERRKAQNLAFLFRLLR